MSKNIYPNNFSHSCFKMASFIKHLVLILLLKMELLKEKIYTFLKLLKFYCFKCACPSISRPMLFPTLVFLLIGCLSLSWIGSLCFKPSFPINLCFPLSFGYLGALCFVRDVRPHVSKLDPKSLKCIFLGYSRVQKGYIIPVFAGTWFLLMSLLLRILHFLKIRSTLVKGRMMICSFKL